MSAAPWYRVGGRFRQSMADIASPKPPTKPFIALAEEFAMRAGIHAQSARG
jgi:hypothetical protein